MIPFDSRNKNAIRIASPASDAYRAQSVVVGLSTGAVTGANFFLKTPDLFGQSHSSGMDALITLGIGTGLVLVTEGLKKVDSIINKEITSNISRLYFTHKAQLHASLTAPFAIATSLSSFLLSNSIPKNDFGITPYPLQDSTFLAVGTELLGAATIGSVALTAYTGIRALSKLRRYE